MVRILRGRLIERLLSYTLFAVAVLAIIWTVIGLGVPGLKPAPGAVPPDQLTVERMLTTKTGFALRVRVDSVMPLLVAQTQVDGAFWTFTQEPPGPLRRGASAWIRVDFPWVAGEPHHLQLITATGVTIDATVEAAFLTPPRNWRRFADYALLGLFVGMVPVTLGMFFFPVMRRFTARGLEFMLTLAVGLLAFLWIDMTLEGFAFASRASPLFQGGALVLVPMALTFAAVAALSPGANARGGIAVAFSLAFGIGFHNFGEGLAIGAALARHEVVLGASLVLGFALHNLTEGLGVVAPLGAERASWATLAGLALLAGFPAVPGVWLGAWFLSPHWAAICFGVGAGAVLQVVLEIDRFLSARVRPTGGSRFSPVSVLGYILGMAVMYATSLLLPT